MYSYKSWAFINNGGTGLLVVAYTERVVHVCAAMLTSTYYSYCLWYVPSDIFYFPRYLGMVMEVPIGSRANVRKVL